MSPSPGPGCPGPAGPGEPEPRRTPALLPAQLCPQRGRAVRGRDRRGRAVRDRPRPGFLRSAPVAAAGCWLGGLCYEWSLGVGCLPGRAGGCRAVGSLLARFQPRCHRISPGPCSRPRVVWECRCVVFVSVWRANWCRQDESLSGFRPKTSANVGELKLKQLNIIWDFLFLKGFIMRFVIFLCSASVCCYLCIRLPVGKWQPLPGIR